MPPRKKIADESSAQPLYTMQSTDRLMHPHWEDMGRKIMLTLIAILIAYGIVFLGALIRNELREYYTIGYADKMERTISLDAVGKAEVVPDIAMTTIGMIAQGETVESAQVQNTLVMNTLLEQLRALGIAQADIETTNYNIYPIYNFTESDGRVQDGYEVSQSVVVKIRDIEVANSVLALAGEVGANSVSGLRFTIDDTEVYKAEARADALRQIDAKARQLKKMLGVDVVSVINYYEYDAAGYGPLAYERSFMSDEMVFGSSVLPDIEAGTKEVLLNVSITFEIR
jgi:uncharacterized protein YggE